MKTIKARFNGGVFVPERKLRLAEGQLVHLTISRSPPPEQLEDENPSPSGDSYFLDSKHVQGILDSAEEMRRGEGKAFSLKQLDAIMGL